MVKSFTSWYALLLWFFLRFSSISLHCSPLQFSLVFFMHLVRLLFTSLYFSDPSEKKRKRKVRFSGAGRDFSPRVNCQCTLSYGVRNPPCAIACIYLCAHVKDSVVHVRVRWIMETVKHPACTPGWVARLCRR